MMMVMGKRHQAILEGLADYSNRKGICQGATVLWSNSKLKNEHLPSDARSQFFFHSLKALEKHQPVTGDLKGFAETLLLYQCSDIDPMLWGRSPKAGIKHLIRLSADFPLEMPTQYTTSCQLDVLLAALDSACEGLTSACVFKLSSKYHTIGLYYDPRELTWQFFNIDNDLRMESFPEWHAIDLLPDVQSAFDLPDKDLRVVLNVTPLFLKGAAEKNLQVSEKLAYLSELLQQGLTLTELSKPDVLNNDLMSQAILYEDMSALKILLPIAFEHNIFSTQYATLAALLGNAYVVNEVLKRTPSYFVLASLLLSSLSDNQLEITEMISDALSERAAYQVLLNAYRILGSTLTTIANLSLQPLLFSSLHWLVESISDLQPYLYLGVFLLSSFYGIKLSTNYLKGLLDPFCLAIIEEDIDAIKKQLSDGYDINAIHSKLPCPPLYVAARQGNREIIELLFQARELSVDNAIKGLGMTALHVAARRDNVWLIEKLLLSGAERNLQDAWGRTAMHLAARAGNVEVVQLLALSGADVNIVDNYGETPVDIANRHDNHEVVALFQNLQQVSDGALVNFHSGLTPRPCI
jgi:hypothetical protein